VVFGGVAWAQNRGLQAVEIRVDDSAWQPAQLGDSYSHDTWRMWSFPREAKSPGKHTITVRASDNTGAVQNGKSDRYVPDGATGRRTVSFTVAKSSKLFR
jgi:hypothetical protein